jgi:hypothetical protein
VYIHYLLSRDTIDQVMHEVVVQKAEAIRHAMDGKARFLDVAEILKKATGDVQLEVARRIQLLPQLSPAIDLQAVMNPHIAPGRIFAAPATALLPSPAFAAGDDSLVFAPPPAGRPSIVQLSLFGSML